VRQVREDVVLRIGAARRKFPDVKHERCGNCGERIFGVEASRMFDAAIHPRRSWRAA
jgi:hypothetical protein